MSSSVSGAAMSVLLRDAVGAGHERQRVDRLRAGLLQDPAVGERAVAGDDVVAGLADGRGELAADPARRVVVLGAVPPGAVDPRALGDDGDLRARQLHEVPALEPDVLRPEMTWRVVRDRLGPDAGEVGV